MGDGVRRVSYGYLMVRPLVTAAILLALAPSAASAKACGGDTYGAIDRTAFPTVGNLKAVGLPKKTDGYAPRCLVAESVAGLVQASWRDDGNGQWSFAATVRPRGARWDGGRWRCTYVAQGEDIAGVGYVAWVEATCKHRTRSGRRVTFDLGS